MADESSSRVGSGGVGDEWVGSDVPDVADPIVQNITVPSLGSVFSGQALTPGITQFRIVPSLGSVFGGHALLPRSTGVTIFVDGVDKTSYFAQNYKGAPISGSLSVGSIGNALLPINNDSPTGFRTPWTPSAWDEIQVYLGTYRIFGGYVNTVEQTMYLGDDGTTVKIYQANCWSYGAILDRTIVAAHFEIYDGALANIIMFNLVSRFLTAQWGILWGGTGGDTGPGYNPFSINWWSFTQVNQYICSAANWSAYVDQFKVLRFFGIASTARPAPFTLSKMNSKFETLKPTRGGAYYNYIIVRNSQNLGSIWHDDFAGDADGGTGTYAPLTAALTQKPAVYVDTGSGFVAQEVVDPGSYGMPWDFYWLAFEVVRNPALSPLASSDVVRVSYPLDIDYVAIAKDDGEIAAHGPVMQIVEIKDYLNLADMQTIADGELAKGIEDITTIEGQTDIPGIEPGQIATVNAEYIDNWNFMIESVDFTQIGPDLFRFTYKGTDANVQRRNSAPALFQKLLQQATQARDRVQTPIVIALWTTVSGQSNPGASTGIIPGAIRTAPTTGVCVKCTLNFQSVTTTPTTAELAIDVLVNGTSIFPTGTPAKMLFPAGATSVQTVFIFKNDPQEITVGDVITLNCIEADTAAFDGVLELTVQG